MYDLKIKTTLDQAEEYFQAAEEEFYKPAEDVLPYKICQNAYKAIRDFLIGFLLNHDLKSNPAIGMKELLTECRQFDSKFDTLQLDLLYDAHEKQDVWLDLKVAQKFMDLARQTRTLVCQT